METFDPRKVAESLEDQERLDRLAAPLATRVSGAFRGPLKDVLSGLTDGEVVHGPASAPQPAFEVRALGGKVEVRRRSGGRRPGDGEG